MNTRRLSRLMAACALGLVLPNAMVWAEQDKPKSEREILYWVAPMDPSYRREQPGKSPMGMDLVPVYADDVGPEVKVSPAVVQNHGVRTASAQTGTLWRRIDTVGYVEPDESRLTHVSLRTEGWIERLAVKSEGERVRKGQLLFELYSPALVTAQEEYLQARASGSKALIRASRDRLEVLGVSQSQIDALSRSQRPRQRIEVFAPQDGIVQQLNVREGMFVKPANTLMSLVDLSSVWVIAEVFESQSQWVAAGRPAEMNLTYLPGKRWEGQVQFVYPQLDPKTRTLRVRLRFDNPAETLKPNMYASVTIYGGPKPDVLTIPAEALIRTGRENRVVVSSDAETFSARQVEVGIQSGDRVEVLSGLEPGERVVTSGQFLIDSEASLSASLQRMSPSEGSPQSTAAVPSEHEAAHIEANGVVRGLMAEHGMVTLEHEPVDALGWPAMIMDFNVDPAVSLEGLKEGERVRFELKKDGKRHIITSIVPVGTNATAASDAEEKPLGGSGIVRKLMSGHGMVTLEHEPIDALGWPSMTMDFRVGDDVSLAGIREGDSVQFRLQKKGKGYVIAAIEPAAGRGDRP